MTDNEATPFPPQAPLADLPVRQPVEMRTDWHARPAQTPDGQLWTAILAGNIRTPAALCSIADGGGAAFLANRLNRAAFLENALTSLATSLRSVIATNGPNIAVRAYELHQQVVGAMAHPNVYDNTPGDDAPADEHSSRLILPP